jgi:Ribonuclease G/E
MKGRVILIDMPKERASQAALLIDGRLEDLLLDPPKGQHIPAPGEIYWAKIDRLIPNMGGAFVKLTPEHTGFLREAKGLKEAQGIIVQVSTFAEEGKATPVTTRVVYKGRTIIHTPGAPGVNVSRQIKKPEERQRLTSIIDAAISEKLQEAEKAPPTLEEIEIERTRICESGLDPAPADLMLRNRKSFSAWLRHIYGDGGFILRTSAEGAEADELNAELEWVTAGRRSAEPLTRDPPPLNYAIGGARGAVDGALREWTIPLPLEVAAGSMAFRFYGHLDETLGPTNLWGSHSLHSVLVKYDAPDPFDHYGVWDEIERLKSPRVDLPSGAWMAVEATRAMITVDVNTAGEFGGGAPLTANLEAAKELPRQLRLRGLGGQIVIDFAPMKKADRKRVEEALKAAFRQDPIDTTLAGWTPLGNFELQRKRERRPLAELFA